MPLNTARTYHGALARAANPACCFRRLSLSAVPAAGLSGYGIQHPAHHIEGFVLHVLLKLVFVGMLFRPGGAHGNRIPARRSLPPALGEAVRFRLLFSPTDPANSDHPMAGARAEHRGTRVVKHLHDPALRASI